jgi:hypothetical protein
MKDDKITFIKAENGIIVEIQAKEWDGHTIERKLFFKINRDSTELDILREALFFAFKQEFSYILQGES